MYDRRIIFDIDDTISRTIDRNFDNAKPIQPVIDKINRLYDEGWEIFLSTARGYLSCDGDRSKAEEKYRYQIEHWLKINGVKYHKLSFQKELATYYVDDKALTPEDFLNLDIQILHNGMSGSLVERRGNKVYKTHPNSLSVAKWYELAGSIVNTPYVFSVIGNTLCVEYIEHDNTKEINIEYLIKVIRNFSKINTYSPFQTYINRIKKHIEYNNDFFDFLPILETILGTCESNNSFSHGDFSVENLLLKKGTDSIYLIDPIYEPENYSSYLLDVAKLLHSYRKHELLFNYRILFNEFRYIGDRVLLILEISQWIRILKYCSDNTLKEKYKKIIRDLIDGLPVEN